MRNKIIEVAQSQIGVKEDPFGSNMTKYGAWFGLDGKAWCGQFVSWCFNEAGLPLGTVDFKKGFAGCRYATRNIKKWGKIVTKPLPGDIAFFDFDGDGQFNHTGIFKQHSGGGYFQCIEGNTSQGNDTNGGAVMCRERRLLGVLFIQPNVLADHNEGFTR